jgi:EAL domain-containing protein (putative c-di-GMP-specific phosphodiesterase class I)
VDKAQTNRLTTVGFLEGFRESSRRLERIPLVPLPFRVGRQPASNLVLPSGSISQRHAEIFAANGELWLRDLGSTNGTFVNQQRVDAEVQLVDGDIVHFADQEFRLALETTGEEPADSSTLLLRDLDLPRRLTGGLREIQQLLKERAVVPAFQPIVRLDTAERVGYEALGRGQRPDLPVDPRSLFEIASAFDLECPLSEIMRERAVTVARTLAGKPLVFLNTHPRELADPRRLLDSLAPLLAAGGPFTAVLEIHESAVTDLEAMKVLRSGLSALGIHLAYDDFGAGEARLLHLAEVPPDYLKFDISLVGELDRASEGRRRLLESLVGTCRELGIRTLAEGIERPAEAGAALEVGFELAQGYLFGPARPLPQVADEGKEVPGSP